jgi:hypothetical protein
MNKDIRKITDGAMMVAIIGAVLLLDRQLAGTVSSMVLFLFPLPMVFYSAKYGLKDSWMVLFAVFVLLAMLGTPQSMFFVGCEAIIGMVYGSGVHKGVEPKKLLLITCILGAATELLALVISAAFFGYDIADEVAVLQTELSGFTDATGMPMPEQYSSPGFLKGLFLFSTILLGVMEGSVTHLMSRILLKRMKIKMPETSRQRTPYEPEKWHGYLALAATVGFYAAGLGYVSYEPAAVFLQGAGIVAIVYLIVYGFVGFRRIITARFPQFRAAAVIVPLLLLLFSPLMLVVSGFLYITTDIREKLKEGVNNASGDQ